MVSDMKRKSGKKKRIGIVLGIIAAVLAVTAGGAGLLFREELAITASICSAGGREDVFYMEVESDYHFEEFLAGGGASSDAEVSAFLTSCISKGFYQVDVTNEGPACSVISAEDESGTHVWGRNFDWTGSVPIIVKCIPEDGYASVSTCDFQNITNSTDVRPDNFVNKMLAIAALYVPMDGINEAGLCVADLEVNEGGMKEVDTDKPDLTITTVIRLLLNRAATVKEAVELLGEYDIHASGGISHHLAISDAAGASVCVEFVDGEMVVVETDCVTNFNMANGDISAGGESAQNRYELLCSICENSGGILTEEKIKGALSQVSQTSGEWTTQWSIVYSKDTQTAAYYFDGVYEEKITYQVGF